MQQLRRRFTAALVTAALLVTASACGEEKVSVSKELTSTTTSEWKLVTSGQETVAVGHGMVVTVPSSWVTYGDEREGLDGSTMEWAVGLPEGSKPFPAALQISAGIKNRGAQIDRGMSTAAEQIAKVAPGYELIDKGEVDIPGARKAEFLRFHRSVTLADGSTAKAEQLTLMIGVAPDVSSTIRFTAPAEQWDDLMKAPFESVKVTL